MHLFHSSKRTRVVFILNIHNLTARGGVLFLTYRLPVIHMYIYMSVCLYYGDISKITYLVRFLNDAIENGLVSKLPVGSEFVF